MAGKYGSAVTTVAEGLGDRVRAARKELGLSQAQLAGEELTKGFISQLESGLVRPSIRSLQLIAGRLGKPLDYFVGDGSITLGKRLAFHRLAAEAAAERRDWDEVRQHVAQGLDHAIDGHDRAALLHLLGRADVAAREFERTFDLVAEALSLTDAESDPELVANLLSLRGHIYAELGQLVASTEAYEAALDVVEKHELVDTRLRSRILISLGTVYRRLGRTSKAIAAYEPALAMASRSSELLLAARGFMGIAVTHYDSGELDAAIGYYRRALDLFQRIADIDFELSTLQSIAAVQFENGEIDKAKTSAERAMKRALEVGNAHWAGVAEVILARIALREERAQDALRMAKHAESVLSEAGDRIQQADALGATAAAYEALGLSAEADAAYLASLDQYSGVEDIADRSGMAVEYARVLRARGEIEKAFEMLELARMGASAR